MREGVIAEFPTGAGPLLTGLTAECLHLGAESLAPALHGIILEVLASGQAPSGWRRAAITAIHKKGDSGSTLNYRGIAIVDLCMKVFARVLLTRLEKHVDPLLLDCQHGFRKHRGTVDLIATVRLIQERCRDHRHPLHLAKLDLRQAFDRVNREALWSVMETAYKVHPTMLQALRTLYTDSEGLVFYGGDYSDAFPLNTGVKQGCLLSPLLFAVYIDYIARLIRAAPGGPGNRPPLVPPGGTLPRPSSPPGLDPVVRG
jgi:hypothetical protein